MELEKTDMGVILKEHCIQKNIRSLILEILRLKTSLGTPCPALLQARVSLLRSLAHNSKIKRERELRSLNRESRPPIICGFVPTLAILANSKVKSLIPIAN